MAETTRDKRRQSVGYGSSYRRGDGAEVGNRDAIGSVLGGQVWMVKPDRKARLTHPCLWMEAGVIGFKNCNNYYDCGTCKFDQGMHNQVAKGKQISWQDAMRKKPDRLRMCRHSMTQRIEARLCGFDYRCASCDFDQIFEDYWTPKTGGVPWEVHQIKGFDVPVDYCFHNGHAWARIESGGCIRIGLDDFALKLMGRSDSMDLPLTGKQMNQDRPGWSMERSHNRADVLAPVDGVVMEVNARVRRDPALANHDPYGEGWLCVVRPENVKHSVKSLIHSQQSLDWISQEVATLESMIEDVAGPLAADGGTFEPDIFGNLPDLGWKNLTRTFLKTG